MTCSLTRLRWSARLWIVFAFETPRVAAVEELISRAMSLTSGPALGPCASVDSSLDSHPPGDCRGWSRRSRRDQALDPT